MILKPFTVNSRGKKYQVIDFKGIDSESDRHAIQQMTLAQVDKMQKDAMCVALGLDEVGKIMNVELGVYRDDALVGVFFIAKLDYQSGPWKDLDDWEVISNDPAVFHGRVMPGFHEMDEEDGLDLAVDVSHHLMDRKVETVGGKKVKFKKLSWAIFKGRPDAVAMEKNHDKAKDDNRFKMTEEIDPSNPLRTLVDIELK